MLARCEETNLVLNWEKCHFMVQEGIVLGHRISARGIEVDKAKIEAIEKLPPPSSVKGIHNLLKIKPTSPHACACFSPYLEFCFPFLTFLN